MIGNNYDFAKSRDVLDLLIVYSVGDVEMIQDGIDKTQSDYIVVLQKVMDFV